MLPKNLALDEARSPKNFDELRDQLETEYRVEQEPTTLESIELKPDGTVRTPAGEWRATQDFLESCSSQIGMPLGYAYKISPELFCENFNRRRGESATPVTVSRIRDVAIGLVNDRKFRYRPARSVEVVRALRPMQDLQLRRASASFLGVDLELVRPGAEVEPAVGDVVEVGIAVTNSESGGRQLKASAYSYRLVCTNGAILADALGVARWPNDPRMSEGACLRSLQSDVASLCGKLEAVSRLYQSVASRFIPLSELWNLWRRVSYVVPRAQVDAVLGMSESARLELQRRVRLDDPQDLAVATPRSVYEMHNRITHAAHGRSFNVRRGLQEIGGDLLSRAVDWDVKPEVKPRSVRTIGRGGFSAN